MDAGNINVRRLTGNLSDQIVSVTSVDTQDENKNYDNEFISTHKKSVPWDRPTYVHWTLQRVYTTNTGNESSGLQRRITEYCSFERI